jgi:hypothetical protein
VLIAVVMLSFGGTRVADAHEARPAYLEIRETTPGRYDVLWRTPLLSGKRLPLALRFSPAVRDLTEPAVRELSDSVVERRVIEVPGAGLAGQRIDFVGLQTTITDVLVRVHLRDGTSTTLVRPSQPWVAIAPARGAFAIAGAYVRHGIEHILFGYDHLLFVLALMLVVPSLRVLLATITAFTVAHSITLALATLGVVRVAGPPVEATIALSILLLAREIVCLQRGGEAGATARWPWVVAFAFGLLHGFGFAGALADIGLSQDDVPLALLSFNVGVEIGQLAFIAFVLGLAGLARRVRAVAVLARGTERAVPFAIGILAAFWFFERLSGFW